MFILFIDNFLFVSQWCMKLAKGNKPLVNMMSYTNSTKAKFPKRKKNRKIFVCFENECKRQSSDITLQSVYMLKFCKTCDASQFPCTWPPHCCCSWWWAGPPLIAGHVVFLIFNILSLVSFTHYGHVGDRFCLCPRQGVLPPTRTTPCVVTMASMFTLWEFVLFWREFGYLQQEANC